MSKIECITVIFSMLLFFSILMVPVYSELLISSEMRCYGNCTIQQAINNNTIKIESNKSIITHTEITDSDVIFLIESTGNGKVETNFSGNYSLNTTADNKIETTSGVGVLRVLYTFLKSLLLFGWVTL